MSERLTLRIEKAIYGGAGLGRHEGKAVFTPFTLPGELVTASITKAKGSFAEAALESVLEPGPTRATPPCPYFGICGGCHYQHATYPAQLAMKASILEETLSRARLSPLPEIITHAGEPLGYRNRIRLHIDPVTSALGYRQRGSHRLLPIDVCPIAAPELQHDLETLSPVFATHQIGKLCSQVELSINQDGSELLLLLWARPLHAGVTSREMPLQLARLCAELKPLLPSLRGAGIQAAPAERKNARDRRQQRDETDPTLLDDTAGTMLTTLAEWGEPRMTYVVGDHAYQVSLGAFFQVNRSLIRELVDLATAGRSGAIAWDLYAGVGLFSTVLARQFAQVIAVEGAPISSSDLRRNLPQSSAHQAIRSSTLQFLRQQRQAARRRQTPDFVLVDPPRAGLGPEVTELLSQIRPPQITYVSCDPATLARDLRALVESGYQIQQLHLIDLFPQTFHMETVVLLSLA